MLSPCRRGVALLEMVVALSLFAVVLSAFAALVARHERAHAILDARVQATAQLREGESALVHDILPLAPAQGDVVEALDSAIAIRAVITTAIACDTMGTSIALAPPDPDPARSLHARLARPQSNDTAWLWSGEPGARGWTPYAVQSVAESAARCPDSTAILPLPAGKRTVLTLAGALLPGTAPGAPVRVTRRVRWSLYKGSDRRWWLGMREQAASGVLATIQPVLGPLRPYSRDSSRSGALFQYEDPAGQRPASPAQIALVRVVLRADSAAARAAPHAAPVRDSLVIAVAPRG